MVEISESKSVSKKTKKMSEEEERKFLKKVGRIPSDVMQLVNEEESDSDMSVPETDSKPRKIVTKRTERRKEKLKNKSVEGFKYLLQWKVDRANWKFNRKIQVQLIQSCLNRHVMTLDNFPHFLEYASSIKGGSAAWLRKLCEAKIQEYDAALLEVGEGESVPKDLKAAQKRAKKILSRLNETDSPSEA